MTVSQLIDWLKTQDQEATVEIVNHKSGHQYYTQGGTALVVDFDPTQHAEYTDLRGNQFITPLAPHYNRRSLLLGVWNG